MWKLIMKIGEDNLTGPLLPWIVDWVQMCDKMLLNDWQDVPDELLIE